MKQSSEGLFLLLELSIKSLTLRMKNEQNMSTDVNSSLDSFSLFDLHQKNFFYGNFLFLNKILKLWRFLYDL